MGVHPIRIVAEDLAALRVELRPAARAGPCRLDDDRLRRPRGKGEAQSAGMIGRRHFGAQLAAGLVGHGDGVIIGRHRLVGMAETQAAIFRTWLEPAHFGHQRDVAIVTHPHRRLVRADEAGDPLILIGIRCDADPVLTGLRGPVGHAEGHGDERHGAGIVRPNHGAPRADRGVHPVDRRGGGRQGRCQRHQRNSQHRPPQPPHPNALSR